MSKQTRENTEQQASTDRTLAVDNSANRARTVVTKQAWMTSSNLHSLCAAVGTASGKAVYLLVRLPWASPMSPTYVKHVLKKKIFRTTGSNEIRLKI